MLQSMRSRWLLAIWFTLSMIGLAMAASAPVALAQEWYGDPLFFLKKQLLHVCIGALGLFLCIRIPYNVWCYRHVVRWIFWFCTASLIVVLFMPAIRNVHRWIRLGPFSFQPSELAKLGIIVYIAFLVHRRGPSAFRRGGSEALYGSLMAACWSILILKEPALVNAFILVIIAVCMVSAGGLPLRAMLTGLAVLVLSVGLALTLWVKPPEYWRERLAAFFHPEQHLQTAAYQQKQALIALGYAGPWGTGYGRGIQKLFYVPEPHNDYVFAILGEEMGIGATGLVLLLFMVLVGLGFQAARRAHLAAGRVMAVGLTTWLGLQAFLNMSVVTGLLPPTGVVLPFISYGGTAYLLHSCAVGILISISEGNLTFLSRGAEA